MSRGSISIIQIGFPYLPSCRQGSPSAQSNPTSSITPTALVPGSRIWRPRPNPTVAPSRLRSSPAPPLSFRAFSAARSAIPHQRFQLRGDLWGGVHGHAHAHSSNLSSVPPAAASSPIATRPPAPFANDFVSPTGRVVVAESTAFSRDIFLALREDLIIAISPRSIDPWYDPTVRAKKRSSYLINPKNNYYFLYSLSSGSKQR